jgi:hypothetical protein
MMPTSGTVTSNSCTVIELYQRLLFQFADLTRLDGSRFHLMVQRLVVGTAAGIC